MSARRAAGWLSRFRQPAYTGENRCLPCTVLNVAIALAVTGVLALASPTVAVVVGVASLVVISLRGYLVPGTPALTRRYLPARVLAAVGKAPRPIDTSDLDPAVVLIGAGVLLDEPAAHDTSMAPVFADRWSVRATELLHGEEDAALRSLARSVGVPADALDARAVGTGVAVTIGAERIGQWESPAAYCLDVAAMELLAEWLPDWDRFDVDARGELVGALRLFVAECPDCGGHVTLGETTVASCCSSREVVTVTCTNCETRLLELSLDGAAMGTALDTD